MAATLTDSGELTYLSFNIDKVESTPDGDLMVYGRATDGSVDHDQQIVHPDFSSKAISEWLATGGNVRVQHNPQRDPAGIGVEAHTDENGATFVKSLIVEPIAKRLVSKGVLRAYSVGIANPTIERDMTGKARGGIIKAGKIVEISLVDRPANASCGISLVKSASDGHAEYVGQLFGDAADIQKALNPEVKKTSYEEAANSIDTFDTPGDISIDFTPNDLMRILQEKMVARHNNDLAAREEEILKEVDPQLAKDHREFSQDTRRSLASRGHALPDGSYPIPDTDALRRAAILARSGHGNASAAKKLIARRAKELGVANPLDGNDQDKSLIPDTGPGQGELEKAKKPQTGGGSDVDGDDEDDSDDDVSAKEAQPQITKDPADGDGPAKPKKGKKGKKLPPWLNQSAEKCHTDPKTASGAEEPADMQPAPLGELQESPAKPHMKAENYSRAVLRFKTIGMDTELGILHDLSCPAFHPGEVASYYPDADFSSLIDEQVWQGKALAAATGKSISEAMEAQQAWQAAVTLKNADPQDLLAYRYEMHKAFRDANPGISSFPSPGSISPQRYCRPHITDGHAAYGSGYGSPNSSARVASGSPNAHHFDRPPLGSGHQSPSPSHMKGGFEYPSEQGVPTKLNYGQIEKEKARRALSMLHDHLNHMFPSSCPMLDQDAYRQETTPTTTVPSFEGKSETAEEVLGDVYKYIRKLEKKVRLGEITEAEARTRLSKKTAERYARNLNEQVQKGLTSRDEVLKALGMPVAEPVSRGFASEDSLTQAVRDLEKLGFAITPPKQPEPEVAKGLTPEIMKTMMTEILKPFEEKIEAQNAHIEEQGNLLTEYQQKFEQQQAELSEHRNRWDALASQPDPSTAAFTGLALSPVAKGVRPEGVTKQADTAERIQGMMIRQLERAWRTSENPAEREAAYAALNKYKGMASE